MSPIDILLDDDFDLRTEQQQDLVLGDGTLQHQALLLLSNKGDWRADGTVGVALATELLNEASPDELRQRIRQEFERDGMRVGRIELTEGLPSIDATYE